MTSFNELEGVPCTGNSWLLDEVLRKQWGFTGFVVTDYTAINEMVNHGIVPDEAGAAGLAACAGVDMDMQGGLFLNHLKALVAAGKVPMARIDDAVRRILRLKFAVGLFEDPYRNCDPKRRDQTLMRPRLPAGGPRHGAGAASCCSRTRAGSCPCARADSPSPWWAPWQMTAPTCWARGQPRATGTKALAVKDGLAACGYPVRVVSARGCAVDGTDRSGFEAAVTAAKQADVVVAVMGESAEMSGEAASRARLDLPGVQRELLARLKATGKPVVLVVMNGRPLDLSWESANMDAIVEAWHLGTQAGPAVVDVLFGDHNPSARLVSSFPRSVGQVPVFYAAKPTGRPFDANNKYTTKYLDTPNEPLYPFGYGLSYTTFRYSPLTLDHSRLAPGESLKVQVTVTNTGSRDGEEVAQLYIRDLVGSVTRPVKELRAFQRVALKPGESRTLTFPIGVRDLAFYRRDMTFGAEAGAFRVWVGPNSATGSEATFELTETVTVPEE